MKSLPTRPTFSFQQTGFYLPFARTEEHAPKRFTKSYGVTMLVYFEQHDSLQSALERERRIKRWARAWKIDLIRSRNPDWRDLFDDLGA